ncbi:MAG: hypothetical protein J0L84_09405 [Verrucomicrobia bacterium]|nr:hypothetical protein [Verrucomicrobiota bacterium]
MNASSCSVFRRLRGFATRCLLLLLAGLTVTSAALAQGPRLLAGRDAYAIGEGLSIEFTGGPGNPKDWVGIYPLDVVPGATPSTLWNYVDGTRDGVVGLTEGVLTFPTGLNFAGTWKAYLLENDTYTILAETSFEVVEIGTPLVSTSLRTYRAGEDVIVTFASAPGNPKDWVGIYKAGETPGSVSSTRFLHLDGSTTGQVAVTDGSLTFGGGLTDVGDYVAYLLRDDSYDILSSTAFSVAATAETTPRLLSIQPANGAVGVAPKFVFQAAVTNGTTSVNTNSISLALDGAIRSPAITVVDGLVTIRWTNATAADPLSMHQYRLTFTDNATPAQVFEFNGTFTVADYQNIVLPAPLVFENFDGTPEGEVPPGWNLKSYTEVQNPDLDLGNLDSASFANWLVINVDRFTGSFVTYSNPDNPEAWETDYRRVLSPNPLIFLNGENLTGPLASGRMLFGDSGYRNGASQVLWVTTPDFDLSGKTDVHVAFKSLYEQNQDSIGTLEYSVDGGATWLPVAYLLNAGDVVRAEDGSVDAESTLNTEAGDIARYVDENGVEIGGTYGAFLGVPVSAALAPFLQGRLDDNAVESKRVEKYRLPAADNARTVRIRFGYAGTDSWYWGVDDFGLYSIPGVIAPPTLTAESTPEGLKLSWPAGAAGFVLQSAGSLGATEWTPVGGVTGNSVVVPFSAAAQYFRLYQP